MLAILMGTLIGTTVVRQLILLCFFLALPAMAIAGSNSPVGCSSELIDSEELKNILVDHEKFIMEEPGGKRADLRGRNLSKENLNEANLKKAWLQNACLEGANLTYADLSGAKLGGANLHKARLSWANLYDADFTVKDSITRNSWEKCECKFENGDQPYTNLEEANLEHANLNKAKFSGTNMKKARLWGAAMNTSTRFESTCLEEAEFSSRDPWKDSDVRLMQIEPNEQPSEAQKRSEKIRIYEASVFPKTGVEFKKVIMKGAMLKNLNLQDVSFKNACLLDTDFSGSELEGAEFSNSNLTGATLNDTTMDGKTSFFRSDLSDATLRRAAVSIKYLVVTGQDTDNNNADKDSGTVDIRNALKKNYSPETCKPDEWSLLDPEKITGVNFYLAKLINTDFRNTFLVSTNFEKAILTNAKFKSVFLAGSSFKDADLTEADFDSACLSYVRFINTVVKDTTFSNTGLWHADYFVRSKPGSAEDVHGLHTVNIDSGQQLGLIDLRDRLRASGSRKLERDATYAIQNAVTKNSDWWKKIIRYMLFDLTSEYGRKPIQCLLIMLALIPFFAVPYTFAIWTSDEERNQRYGVYKVWHEGRVLKDLPMRSDGKLEKNPGLIFGGPGKSIAYGFYFSLLSAIELGWRDINIGTWIARVQRYEYNLRSTGWVRTVSGFQSLISIYLLALWVLTEFGRPFDSLGY